MKHTPGPWSKAYIYGALRHIERNVDREAFLFDDAAKEIDEGRLNTPDCRGNPADVALIVSAPDLLGALELIENHMGGWTGPDLPPGMLRTIREAIEKAKP